MATSKTNFIASRLTQGSKFLYPWKSQSKIFYPKRYFRTPQIENTPSIPELENLFESRLKKFRRNYEHIKVNKNAIFANSELSLKYIDTYGFDYDYTLASYTTELHRMLYNLCKERLVSRYKYPKELLHFEFDPDFAIRGLHFDSRKGLLLKIDAYQHIELGTVYKGHRPVSDEETIRYYGGTHIPLHMMNPFNERRHSNGCLYHYLDMFSGPEVSLLADIVEFLSTKRKSFHPQYIANDCKSAMADIHHSGDMHQRIVENIDAYICKSSKVANLLSNLKANGKNLFLITNSLFPFVDKGMQYIVGADWRDLFDIIVVRARKPHFFLNNQNPFRRIDSTDLSPMWDTVSTLEKGEIYTEGNIVDFMTLTGWNGSSVLYFGDHVYSDLADPIQRFGWSTGAIVPELENEVEKVSSDEYKLLLSELLTIESLLRDYQGCSEPEHVALMEAWKERRKIARNGMKSQVNPRFGGIFRTRRGPTYFTRRLIRLANVYTSSVTNLLSYPLDYAFYSRRYALPHELAVNFGI